MDYGTWIQAQEIFHQIAELDASEQAEALDRLCGCDVSLRSQTLAMLEEDRRESMLDGDVATLAGKLEQEGDAQRWALKQIGSYTIERLLGEGGMGVVYLAERSGIGGKVAIKVLRDAWVSSSRRKRFAREQRLLAQMNHPGIAQLYEADVLADGTPWFVMEYVDGVTLTTFWEQQRSTVEECLHLFREVCEAVSYAHRRAIIHRDLKPSNILVSPDGKAKLLDFGIAKPLEETDLQARATVTGLHPMTPAYAAPEQLNAGAVGVFTDCYALGVILYELLTGRLPFDEESCLQKPRPEPKRPSAVASPERFLSPPGRDAWADLNVLCLTAMREEPERRYQSAEAILRDIDAFLGKRPLEARTDQWSYRLRKFIARRRAALAYATATLLLVTGLIGFFTWRLRTARDEALAEVARTDRIQSFTANLFRGNEADVGPAEDLRVKTLLDRGREEANSLNGDPEMQADMRETLGDIYRKLGDTKQADGLLESALEHVRREQITQPRKYARDLIELALLRRDEGKLDEAEQLARKAVDASRSIPLGAERGLSSVGAQAMVALGSVLEAKGSYVEAANVLNTALELQRHRGMPDSEAALTLRELANVHFYEGHYTLADSLNRQVLAMHRSLYGEKHPEIAEDLNNLGAIQLELGNLPQAEMQYRQSLAIVAAWYGEQSPRAAEDLTSLGRVLVREKRYAEAKRLLEQALAIQQAIHGHDHLTVASALNELASIETMEDDYDHAEMHYSEALSIWRTTYGQDHQFIGVGLSNLGSVAMAKKEYARAEQMFRQALTVFVATVHENHTNTGIAHIKLGRCLLREKRYIEAEPETRRGYETLVHLVDPSNGFLKNAKLDLVQIYTALNRKQDAERYRE